MGDAVKVLTSGGPTYQNCSCKLVKDEIENEKDAYYNSNDYDMLPLQRAPAVRFIGTESCYKPLERTTKLEIIRPKLAPNVFA